MKFDDKTRTYFDKKVKQVFVYITNRCQLRCKQCLYKPLLNDSSEDLDFNILMQLLKKFREYGAYKISFLGGEPTIYHDKINDKYLSDIIKSVKEMGYKYIRIDTNGQFRSEVLDNDNMKLLDEITFSLDGHCAEINDAIRGKGTYDNVIKNVKYAVDNGYNVQITSCVHNYSCMNKKSGVQNIDNMIRFCEKLGIDTINFHPILKVGVSRDAWIDNTNITFELWRNIYDEILKKTLSNEYSINVRLPMRGIENDSLKLDYEKYFYCPLDMGERALIMPNNQIKVCAFTIGSDYCVAKFNSENVTWCEDVFNETKQLENLDENTLCAMQKTDSKELTPLCMSYKPYQKEIVWKDNNK